MGLSRGFSWSKGGLGSTRRAALRAALQGPLQGAGRRAAPAPAGPDPTPTPTAGAAEGVYPGWWLMLLGRPFLFGLALLAGIAVVSLLVTALWRPQVVVVSAAGLPAYTVVRESDVALRYRRPVHGGFRSPEQVVGRWVGRPVRSGRVVREEDLGPVLSPAGSPRRVVALPLPAAGQLGLRMGDEVSLLLVPRAADAARDAPEVVINHALVLAVTASPAALWVALPEPEVSALGRHLGGASVVVVR